MSREAISSSGLRIDGRRANEFRSINIQFGISPASEQRVDGSALYQQGNTKVLATVNGPREMAGRNRSGKFSLLTVDYFNMPFSQSERKQRGKNDKRSLENGLLIESSLSPLIQNSNFPNSNIHISIFIIQNDGAALMCSLNAAVCALINASIPMNELIFGVNVGIADTHLLLDMNYSESIGERVEMELAIGVLSNKIFSVQMSDKMPLGQFEPLTKLAKAAIAKIHAIVKQHIKSYTESLLNR